MQTAATGSVVKKQANDFTLLKRSVHTAAAKRNVHTATAKRSVHTATAKGAGNSWHAG